MKDNLMQFLRRALTGTFLLAITLGLFAVAVGNFWGAVHERMNREPRERPARERVVAVNTVQVRSETLTPVIQTFGEVQSRRTLEVRTGAAGRVTMLAAAVEDGASVTEGMLLARIDPSDAMAARDVARTDLAEAEAELRDAQRAFALASDELAAAQAQAALRAQALTRQQDLERRRVGTAAAVETAALAAASADQAVLTRRNALIAAESRIEQAGNGVARARIALANAERDLADTEVRAAFPGTLADVAVTAGGLVTQNEKIATLIDPDALEVTFRVSTAQYARLIDQTGHLQDAPVRATLDVLGLDLVALGQLTRVGASVGAGQTGRRLFATLDGHAGFRPGDFVTVTVEEPALSEVARLPATAVDAANTVLVLTPENRLRSADVELLRRQGNDVIVRAPSLEGHRLVAERSPLVGPGILVRDLSAEGPGAARTASASPDEVLLTDERRAALIAAVESNDRMPAAAKARILAQLQQDTVPARMIQRIESRMGG